MAEDLEVMKRIHGVVTAVVEMVDLAVVRMVAVVPYLLESLHRQMELVQSRDQMVVLDLEQVRALVQVVEVA